MNNKKHHPFTGLSEEEVLIRREKGLLNSQPPGNNRRLIDIVNANLFTYFNFINLVLAIIVIWTGRYQNLLFLGTIICNTAIGIVQEYRAAQKLKKLRLLIAGDAKALRSSQISSVPKEEIVLDDILLVERGDQIPVDGKVLAGKIWVNEAHLTGEQDSLEKEEGSLLYSGSFVTAGKAYFRVTHIAGDTKTAQLESQVKRPKRRESGLRDDLDILLKYIGCLLLPLAAALLYAQQSLPFIDSLLKTVASLVGMIPEGLILLTSIALTLGSLRLIRKNTLIQENYSLEALARCDVLCLDKTGTLTTGQVKVKEFLSYKADFPEILASYVSAHDDQSEASKAILASLGKRESLRFEHLIPFSSETKKSSGKNGKDLYELGSYEFLEKHPDNTVDNDVLRLASQGYRLLTFTKNKKILGLVVLEDEVRLNVKDTLDYFHAQGVRLYFISGDSPVTIASLLTQIGYPDAKLIDASKEEYLDDRATVIARMTPFQKKEFIQFLQKSGHTVGMIGDGVNDILALREANFSVAMASGADSARNTANVVLLDNDFAHLPSVILEGRQVINNIQRTATLFLSKTSLAFFLSVFAVLFLKSYPFHPVQFTLLSSACIGIPSFILALEPNNERVSGNFLEKVLQKAIPAGLSMAMIACLYTLLCPGQAGGFLLYIYFLQFLFIYSQIAAPFTKLRLLGLILMISLFLLPAAFFPQLFLLETLQGSDLPGILAFAGGGIALQLSIQFLGNKIKRAL